MNLSKRIILLLIVAGALQSCSKYLDKQPFTSLNPTTSFKTAGDLQLYTNSFYVYQMPNANAIFTGDNTSDYISGNNPPLIMTAQVSANNPVNANAWSRATAATGSWPELRNINYFLQNNTSPLVADSIRNMYSGIARFFRAWWYYNMVKEFGNVPWVGSALSTTDSSLYKAQDPRTLVMDSIEADLDYAIAHAPAAKDNGCSTITKWTALALKARVGLFEGSFRKYHTELLLTGSAATWFNYSVDAATQLINSGNYKLHTTGSPASDYRAVFTTSTPFSDEVILAFVYNDGLKLWHNANAYFTSTTLGNRTSPIKAFMDTYLNKDGSRFTDQPNFDTINFVNEMANRDLRLQQTVRCNGYKYSTGVSAPPDYSYTFTGYQPLKFCVDNPAINVNSQNNNSIPIFRYAEVLLNLAEAKEELGTLTPMDYANTIGLLRSRAGITNTPWPTVADPYMAAYFLGKVSDPVLLEIRRERGVELMLEGFRWDDIRRWKMGKMMEKPYNGVYVPQLNTPYAMNGDGVLNVSFVTATPSSGAIKGVYYYLIDNKTVNLTQGSTGNIIWLANIPRQWDDKMYYDPIPSGEIVLNPNLKQNTGW
ncbi:MAG TPA: RagB/SusD family nutrient uptake outer membrane protein [Puia sp.]|nr:RagB/SusD family nutrient uptake outer membrane protein [Puia sp.]